MSWKRFKNPEFFGLLGKPLLVRLVQHFAPKFAEQKIELPDAALEEKEYFKKLATLGASKKGFPTKMSDVLYGIMALGNEDGKNRLIHAANQMNILREFSQTGTCEDFALQFFLMAPAMFEKKVHEAQILARSSFQVFGSNNPAPAGTIFPPPTDEQLRLLKLDVDEWVAQEYRGEERATQIETYEMEDEHLFLIRIGDSNTRHSVVEGDGFTYQHFRPARDLVITYAAARDEIRINGKGTKKIRMIREAFGRRFFGDPDRFSIRDPFTLAPLVRLGPEALRVAPGQGITEIVLTELIQETDGTPAVKLHFTGPNLFAFAEREKTQLFWAGCHVTGAGFAILFSGQTTPRQFFLREGNGLRQVRNCDVVALYRWMKDKKFRKTKRADATNDEPLDQD
jgi:hypothetical protein